MPAWVSRCSIRVSSTGWADETVVKRAWLIVFSAAARARAAATAYQQGAAVPAGPGWPGAGGDAGGARGSVTAGAEGSESSAASSDAEVVPGATAARRARLRQDEGMLF